MAIAALDRLVRIVPLLQLHYGIWLITPREGRSRIDIKRAVKVIRHEIPWSIGGKKDAFKGFAETLAAAIPGAIVYKTPKHGVVSKAAKRRLNLVEVLDAAPALRPALETLHAELLAGR